MKQDILAPLLITALVVGGGAFYGGMRYQASKNTRTNPVNTANRAERGMFPGGGMGRAGGAGGPGGMGGGFTAGEVVSKDANTLTVKLRDGGSKIIIYSTSTRVSKTEDGTSEDVTTGKEVIVNGSTNEDGSLTASTIQIRPAGQVMMPPMRDGQPRN